ncbi:hypothetical protein [Novosphingobium sp. M1R2S20]|uniref:Response regulator receiver domain-containing protein n=1 Tax=Novosphingobium rhizovicinum TaxID=3228928 RepID=A0ABV3RFK5_9SPHN
MGGLLALLMIEDEAVRTSISFALEVEGIETKICTDPMQLYSLLKPDRTCLLIDQGKDGTEALDLLRCTQTLGVRLPTIVLVSTPSKALLDSIKDLGAIVVEKPLAGDELAEAMHSLTSRGEPKS